MTLVLLACHGVATVGGSHRSSVQVLPKIHQREKRTQNACFQVVGKVQPAGRHSRQFLPVFRNEAHDFPLSLVSGVAQGRFSAHLGAPALQRKGEVQHAQLLLGQGWWRVVLASCGLAACSHGAKADSISTITRRKNPLRTSQMARILH